MLVFGENDHDRAALKHLIEALCPHVEARPMRAPLVLIKNASATDAPTRAERIVETVQAASALSDIRCVFAHEDADDVEPSHEAIAARIEQALRDAGCPCQAHAVVPAWEIEAWWLLWPDLVGGIRPSWREPTQLASRQIGLVRDAKESLAAAVRPSGLSPGARKRFPDYRESDSIEIARRIRGESRANDPAVGRSASYDRFRRSVTECCAGSQPDA